MEKGQERGMNVIGVPCDVSCSSVKLIRTIVKMADPRCNVRSNSEIEVD